MRENDDPHRYDDIIHLPHHVSETHPRMSRANRAVQFAPFAALTGYEAVIDETARRMEAALGDGERFQAVKLRERPKATERGIE